MVESTALEMRRAGNGTVGSNPTLSATQFLHNFPCPGASDKLPETGRISAHIGLGHGSLDAWMARSAGNQATHSLQVMRSVTFPCLTGNL